MAMKIRKLSKSKVESSVRSITDTKSNAEANDGDEKEMAVIAKVRKPNYVPEGMTVRSRISDLMFTADASAKTIAQLEEDPLVASVGTPRPIFADSKS